MTTRVIEAAADDGIRQRAPNPGHPVLRGLLDLVIEQLEPTVAVVQFSETTDGAACYHRPDLDQTAVDGLLAEQIGSLSAQVGDQTKGNVLERGQWGEEEVWLASGPVFDLHSGELRVIISVMVGATVTEQAITAQLEALRSLASTLLAAPPAQEMTEAESRIAQLAPSFGRYASTREFAYGLTNRLCNELRCEQVGLGMVRLGLVRLAAISGCADFKNSSPGVREMSQAMEECYDHGELVVFPVTDSSRATFPIHRQWSVSAGGSNLYSIPLRAGDCCVGVVSLRRRASRPLREEELQRVLDELRPIGPVLQLVDCATRGLASHTAAAFQQSLQRWKRPRRVAMTVLLALAALWFCFGRITYQPLCEATVVSAQLRHITTPFEARLEEVCVRAGDRVKAGDLLVQFQTHALQLELDTVLAEIKKAEVDVRQAIDSGEIAAAALHQAEIEVLLARRANFSRRIEDASIRAPMDGMVVQSHVDKRLGQVFSQGQPVLEFAPHQGWELEVQVPESIATLITPAQSGHFVSAASSSDKVPFEISQVDGSAELIDNKNVFVARAQLEADPAWIRSGMRGVARITTSPEPVYWVALHKLIDWTRMHFWI